MGKTLIVATKFTAVDKFTPVTRKMGAGVQNFANKATVAFNRVERAERKLRKGVSKSVGALGQLGIAFGGLAIAREVGKANIELEQNLKSLSAITGVVGNDFKAFEKQISIVSKSEKRFAGDTAKAFEIVGSAQPILLKNAEALGEVTRNTIILSKATRADLAVSADNVTGVMNQFNLVANQSGRIINALAAGSQEGSAPVDMIALSLNKFGTAANSMNITVEESIGLIETLAEKKIKGAEAGTNLRNILLKMATIKALPPKALTQLDKFGVNLDVVSDKTLPLSKRLKELSKISEDATALTKVFGAENVIAGEILLKNTQKVIDFTKAVTGTNTATQQAAINSNTLKNKWDELVATFKNAVTSTNSENKALVMMRNVLSFLAKNMTVIIKTVLVLISVFAAYKTLMFAVRLALLAYNIVLGITGALTGKAAIGIGMNTAAMIAYKVATVAVTAAQWLWNAALMANPIGLIILAIAALIALVVIVIKKWNEWGAALSLFMGPLGMIISMVQSFRRNWEMIKEAFKEGGIVAGLKAIGATILDSVLMPVQQLLKFLSRIPVIGDKIKPFVDKIQSFREGLGVNTETDEAGKPLNPDATIEKVRTERIEKSTANKLDVNFNDPKGIINDLQGETGNLINVGVTR